MHYIRPTRGRLRRSAVSYRSPYADLAEFFSVAFFWLILSLGFWFCLTETLDQMTQADCDRGIARACEALDRDKG